MRKIQASDPKAKLSQLLHEVERGETIVITRHGRAIARITPETDRRRREIDEAIANIEELGREIKRTHGPVSVEAINSSIHEGHKILMGFVLDASTAVAWALDEPNRLADRVWARMKADSAVHRSDARASHAVANNAAR